jgi:ribose transport system permease protein
MNKLKALVRRRELIVVLLIVIIMITLQIATNGKFLTSANLRVIANRKSPEALATIMITFVLITGNFDLAVASTMALSGMISAWMMVNGFSIVLAIIGGLLTGVLIGLANGLLVKKLLIPSFIATLGTQYIARSLTQVICNGKSIGGLPKQFSALGEYAFLKIAWYFWFLMIVVIVLSYLLRRQKSLAKLFYIGTNAQAADMVGIPSDRLTIYTFVASGFFAAVAGLILTAKSESASPISYEGMEMRYIAAAVIGGASISGGQGSVVGSVLGFLLVVLISNGMTLIGISPNWENVIFGTILAVAAIADAFAHRNDAA